MTWPSMLDPSAESSNNYAVGGRCVTSSSQNHYRDIGMSGNSDLAPKGNDELRPLGRAR